MVYERSLRYWGHRKWEPRDLRRVYAFSRGKDCLLLFELRLDEVRVLFEGGVVLLPPRVQ